MYDKEFLTVVILVACVTLSDKTTKWQTDNGQDSYKNNLCGFIKHLQDLFVVEYQRIT